MKRFNRRKFIEKSTLGLAGAGIFPIASCNAAQDDSLGSCFVHYVLFWLKEPSNTEIRAKFEKALKDAEGKIPEDLKKSIEDKITTLKKEKDGTDIASAKKATESLSAEIQKIGEHLSKNQAAPGGEKKDENVRDAEVKEEKKEDK